MNKKELALEVIERLKNEYPTLKKPYYVKR